jgi:predicted MPP superfamily phosphohydrolase
VADVDGLQIVGLDDLWGRRFDSVTPFRSLDPSRAMLALSHNPDTADLEAWHGFEGWILAGHTHGGQCKPPFLPPPIVPVRNKRYTAGVFELPGGRTMYISRGAGHFLQVRVNVRPEVTVFTLQRA